MPQSIPQEERFRKWKRMTKTGIDPHNAGKLVGVSSQTVTRWLAKLKADAALGPEPEYDGVVYPDALSEEATRAMDDFGYFRRRYFGRITMPWQEQAAYEVVEKLATPVKEYIVANAPPGGGKSTLFTHDIPAWLIVRNRLVRILLGSRTERQAFGYSRRLRRSLTRTRPVHADTDDIDRGLAVDAQSTLVADFGRFKPLNTELWRADEFMVANLDDEETEDKEATVAAYGIDSGFLGGRYDYVIWDDLIDKKCPTPDTPVWMADGTTKRAGELVKGDRVLGRSGPVTVTDVFDNGVVSVCRLTTKAGRSYTASRNHPVWTPDGWIRTEDADGYGVQPMAIHGHGHLDLDEAYLLGAMVGDGCLANNACKFTQVDGPVKDEVEKIAQRLGWRVNRTSAGLSFAKGGREYFRHMGMEGVNSWTKTVPDAVKRANPAAVASFLAGYLDTDGSVDTRRSFGISFVTVSHQLALDVQDLFTRCGISATIARRSGAPNKEGRRGSWHIRIAHHETALAVRILAPIGPKRALLEQAHNLRPRSFGVTDYVVSIEHLPPEPTVGISTSDGTLVLGGILTHNTIKNVEAMDALIAVYESECETRVEPGGCLVLNGQRMKAEDLYRYALSLSSGDDEDSPKYHHIKYRAHYEDRCEGNHSEENPPYPEGCLLDPKRIPWKDQAALAKNKPGLYRVVFQQEDIDPERALVLAEHIDGGNGFPGCWDEERYAGQLPPGVPMNECLSMATVDPSPTKFWAIEWIVWHPATDIRWLVDIERKQMEAPELLDYNVLEQQFSGIMDEWQVRSVAMNAPITTWVVESNVAQRFMLQYTWFKLWQIRRGVQVVPHQTAQNKADPKLGVETIGPIYHKGRMRLPKRGSQAVHQMVDELLRYGWARTDDTVLAHWFFEYNKDRVPIPNLDEEPSFQRPSWLRDTQRGMQGVQRGLAG